MSISLWSHQRRLVDFAASRQRSVWAAGMGTGKTRASIALAVETGARRILVATPLAVIDGFVREIETLVPDATVVTTKGKGTAKERERRIIETIKTAKGMVFVVGNLESLRLMPRLAAGQWCLYVADECHRLKAHNGKSSKWSAKVSAKRTVGLSGTILGQTPLDAFGTWRALGLGHRFPRTLTAFRDRYAVMHPTVRGWIMDWRNLDEFTEIVGRDMIQVRSEDVLDLPGITDTIVPVELSRDEARVHQELKDEMVFIGDDGRTVMPDNPMVCVLRLIQACSGWVAYDETDAPQPIVSPSSKRKSLASVMADLDEPVVIWYRFNTELSDILEVCPDALVLNGQTDQLRDWQVGKGKVLAAQFQAGGTGTTMTRSRVAIYYSQTPSLTDYEQSRCRLHRPGQNNKVSLIHLVASLPSAKLSAEELLVRGRDKKGDVLESILENI
jgi:hypothetical protein